MLSSLLSWMNASLAHTIALSMPTKEAAEPPSTAMREPTAIALDSDEGATLLAGVRTVLDEKLSHSDRTRLGRKVLSAKRVHMAAGTFPGSGSAIVTINVPLRMKDPAA